MTSKNNPDAEGDDLGVLDEAASLDTTSLGILGQTSQFTVSLPVSADDDDLVDDSVVDDEIPAEIIEGVIEAEADAAFGSAEADAADEPEPDDEAVAATVEETETAEVVVERTPVPEPTAASKPEANSEPKAEVKVEKKSETKAEVKPEKKSETKAEVKAEAKSEPKPETTVKPAAAKPAAAKSPVQGDSAPAKATAAKPAAAKPAAAKATPAAKPAAPAVAPREQSAEVTLVSKRLGDQMGQASRETADLLTADRLLEPSQLTKPEPEGAWSHLLYTISGRRINIGDGKRARERKALTARIASSLSGGARFVPVLSRKGGVGKTTITALLGMALADARDDRVIAVDANPDRGTLADRIVRTHGKSVRDLVRIHDDVQGYHDLSAIVARDSTRLDVLASDPDPRIAEAFSDEDYRDVAGVAAHYYSLVLTDTGTGIVHSVMEATLDLSDQIVIVSGLSVDEARLASETLTWLETNGYEEQARNAIIVLNQSTAGSPLVRLNELEAHFRTRAKTVVRVPYDPQIAGGGAIVFANLQPETRQAARELAALLIEGLRARAA